MCKLVSLSVAEGSVGVSDVWAKPNGTQAQTRENIYKPIYKYTNQFTNIQTNKWIYKPIYKYTNQYTNIQTKTRFVYTQTINQKTKYQYRITLSRHATQMSTGQWGCLSQARLQHLEQASNTGVQTRFQSLAKNTCNLRQTQHGAQNTFWNHSELTWNTDVKSLGRSGCLWCMSQAKLQQLEQACKHVFKHRCALV